MTNRFLILSQNPDLTTKIEQLIKKEKRELSTLNYTDIISCCIK